MYVGHDSTVQAHRDYVIRERMPWLLARHDAPATRQLRALGGKALPGLLLMDMSGQLLRTSWTADGASAPARLLNELI